ncbi:MAG: SDR family NAD(P)-dependent oxidoreductase [Sphingobium sp.]|nr:SDR family NAD(P)-dependent oxidoreductase [Sphingobium sp.]
MRLKNKRSIITAAASGMGAAGVSLFAQEGAKVAALDRDEAGLARLVDEVSSKGGEVRGFVVDLLDREATLRVLKEAADWLDGVDVVWNHAGLPAPTDIENFEITDYQRSADLNLTAAITISAAVIPLMTTAGGSLIFTSSTSGLVGSAQSPLYSALKSGVIGLTKGLAVRYAAHNVRVNALCPGPVSTPMLHNDFMTSDPRFTAEEGLARVLTNVPMGRVGEAAEIAQAALFLASEESSFITGVALPIDGGLTAR